MLGKKDLEIIKQMIRSTIDSKPNTVRTFSNVSNKNTESLIRKEVVCTEKWEDEGSIIGSYPPVAT